MNQNKAKVLVILHIPPPINGASMVGKYFIESATINSTFIIDYINLTTSFDLGAIGKGSFTKFTIILKIVAKTLSSLLKTRYALCYMTLTAKGAGFYKDFLIVILLKIFGIKIIYHFHNKGVRQNNAKWYNKLLYRFAFNNTQTIILAPQLYADISDYVEMKDVYFCPNGIPNIKDAIKPDLKTENQNKAIKFLFLSNMMFEKGVFILLEACKILKERDQIFECHFVGAWSDISEDEFSAKLVLSDLTDRVYAYGPVYGEAKLDFFRAADIFVFPTFYHNEAFPLVNLEAMQQSLPIISTPEGGIASMVIEGETGFLVAQKDTVGLADAMQILIENPILRKSMGAKGKKRFQHFFTLESFENNMIQILSDVLERVDPI